MLLVQKDSADYFSLCNKPAPHPLIAALVLDQSGVWGRRDISLPSVLLECLSFLLPYLDFPVCVSLAVSLLQDTVDKVFIFICSFVFVLPDRSRWSFCIKRCYVLHASHQKQKWIPLLTCCRIELDSIVRIDRLGGWHIVLPKCVLEFHRTLF